MAMVFDNGTAGLAERAGVGSVELWFQLTAPHPNNVASHLWKRWAKAVSALSTLPMFERETILRSDLR